MDFNFTKECMNNYFMDIVSECEMPSKRQEFLLISDREVEAINNSQKSRDKIERLWLASLPLEALFVSLLSSSPLSSLTPSVIQGPVMNQTKPGSRLTAITSANNSSGESSPENTNYLRVSALFGNR